MLQPGINVLALQSAGSVSISNTEIWLIDLANHQSLDGRRRVLFNIVRIELVPVDPNDDV